MYLVTLCTTASAPRSRGFCIQPTNPIKVRISRTEDVNEDYDRDFTLEPAVPPASLQAAFLI